MDGYFTFLAKLLLNKYFNSLGEYAFLFKIYAQKLATSKAI
jgi:hypothetical protein